MNEHTIYDHASGDAPFRRLVDAFYAGVAGEPLLRPMYPEDLTASKEHLFLFLTQYFGAPPRYNQLRGHPRLRMRHMPFKIGQAERDTWLRHMLAALDQAGFPEDALPSMREYFERSATFLLNHAEQPANTIELRG